MIATRTGESDKGGLWGRPKADPYHGKLFYKCGNRDRTFPLETECKASAIRASSLEDAVLGKLCEAIQKVIGNIETEENRLLDAYRANIITINQLKDQMAKVQEKKEGLENEKQSLLKKQEKGISPVLAKKTITDYCKHISKRLEGLRDDFEGKRYLLSLAVNKVVLEGKTVRIKGIIPCEGDTVNSNIAYRLSPQECPRW